MATRTETRPMSPFARARVSAGADVTIDLRATIAKVDELIRTEQAHNNALRELITGLETRIQTDLSGVRRSVTTLEARVTALEGQNRTLTTEFMKKIDDQARIIAAQNERLSSLEVRLSLHTHPYRSAHFGAHHYEGTTGTPS